jgi:hypothetical protein
MPPIARRFQYDQKLGKVVEVTEAPRKTHGITKWNYPSWSMGVHPSQVPAAQAELSKHGVTTQYTPDGEPIIRDKRHLKRHAEALGFYARNGGYSDPQRK